MSIEAAFFGILTRDAESKVSAAGKPKRTRHTGAPSVATGVADFGDGTNQAKQLKAPKATLI
jgi:hypothetical protein